MPRDILDDTTRTTSRSRPLTARQGAALAALTLPVMLIAIDSTVLGFAVPELTAALNPSGTQLLWVVDVYSFVLAGLLVTMGTLGDRIGRRRLLIAGALGFGIASALAAFAPSTELLIAARALMGVAGATLMPSTLSLIRNVFTDRQQRRLAISVWAAAAAGGAALGPIVGGLLLEHFWWGSVFLINLPLMVVLLVAAPLVIPESKNPNPGAYDVLSAVLALAAILPFVYGIKHLAGEGPDLIVLATVAAGAAFGWWFVRRQRTLSHPMIDLALFANRIFSAAVLINLLSVFTLVSSLFFATQYLQGVLALRPLQAGLWLMPAMVTSILTSLLAVVVARHFSLAASIATGMLLAAAGYAAMILLGNGHDLAFLITGLILIGAGVGLAEALTNDAIMNAVPAERSGAASAISETAYELGAALGVAIMGSVLAASYRSGLDLPAGVPDGAAERARETLGAGLSAAERLPGALAGQVGEAIKASFTSAVQLTAVVSAALMLAAAVLAALALRRQTSC